MSCTLNAPLARRVRRWESFSRHHRRPTSIGGETRDANIYRLPTEIHSAWHATFGNMCVPKMVILLNVLCEGCTIRFEKRELPIHPAHCPADKSLCSVECGTMLETGKRWHDTGERTLSNRREAWARLQALVHEYEESTGLDAVIDYINFGLLDPDYTLLLEKK
jgi:hypothetical protein